MPIYGKNIFRPTIIKKAGKAGKNPRLLRGPGAIRIRRQQAEQALIKLDGQGWPGFDEPVSVNALARQVLGKKVMPYNSHRSVVMLLQDLLDADKISFPKNKP